MKPKSWYVSLKLVTEILEKSGLKYFLDQGTLLGIIRDNDFISWDKDIDIGLLVDEKSDELKISGFLEMLREKRIPYKYTGEHLFINHNNVPIGFSIYRKKNNNYNNSFLKYGLKYGKFSKIIYSIYLILIGHNISIGYRYNFLNYLGKIFIISQRSMLPETDNYFFFL